MFIYFNCIVRIIIMYLKNNYFGCSFFICVLYYVYGRFVIMFKKRTSYEVNVQGINFWRKIINEDNTEVFVKSSLNEPFMIYIDKAKGNEYLDWVTGRLFDMEDMGKDILIGLSNIRISKNNINICDDVVCKAQYILNDKDREEEYTNISEGLLYDSYFCDIISFKYGLDVIPANFVYEEIRRVRKIYKVNNDKDNIKCKSLNRKRK